MKRRPWIRKTFTAFGAAALRGLLQERRPAPRPEKSAPPVPRGRWRQAIWLVRQTWREFLDDKAPRLGAALAFYATLSMPPFLVLLVSAAGLLFGAEAAAAAVAAQMEGLTGAKGGEAVKMILESARRPATGILGTVFGALVLLLSASGVFGQLQDALNTIWEVKPPPKQGVVGFVKRRFFSFLTVLGVGFLLVVSLGASAVLASAGTWAANRLALPGAALVGLHFASSLVAITFLFAVMFKYVPDVHVRWKDVWIGAFLTALLFSLGKFAIGLYLGRSSIGSAYGAAGSIILLVVWVYYSSQIYFFGAEMTQVYTNTFGSRMKPARGAVPVSDAERLNEGENLKAKPA